MKKLERLAYWKNVARDPSPTAWSNEEEDLFYYFQRFRPDGEGVERVFEGLHRGDEILARLFPFYQHTKEGADRDAYFVVRKPLSTTRDELLEVVTLYLDKIRQIAVTSNDYSELVTLLDSIRIETEKGEPPQGQRSL